MIPIRKKSDKTDCSNYRGMSLLSTSYKMLSNILLAMQMRLLRFTNMGFGIIDQ
jgi:hypothetical protein